MPFVDVGDKRQDPRILRQEQLIAAQSLAARF
jgi:hypothetical protein